MEFLDRVECPKCHRRYKNRKTMLSHYSHDCRDKEKLNCHLCWYSCTRRFQLKVHMNKRHPDVDVE
ncbi:unnamed protein product [Acanthoscelides obtectus]|uniref:C2H2-type domain-containing protein n=1 Tax=Acanthoscelides obtectus TaxID=200917 RepID=A0A9P0JZB2_ACAOB|nr:unnamed protein product [Acanthoscelides obtectus]CAK1669702.1 hypothetical protein AOBTE_LOCUS27186 [Acanthoscelides obtectus]